MPHYTITLPGGQTWTPRFATGIDGEKCIGCGRCFKVCGRDVLQLMAVDEDGALIAIQDDDDEYEKKVMTIVRPGNCVGCEACSRTCTKKCISHAATEV
jgi:Nif-specific ferredoxin III